MLVEVQCDKFIKNGQIREPIRFHTGLNAVLGDDNGSNSIGKSTFLMILDFVFGGSDYVKKCTDVQENVKNHTINFTFEFEGKKYHFARNTVDYNKVIRCNASYQPLDGKAPLSIQQYWEFLCERYGFSAEGITWRGAVARFIRVYKRDTLDEERPLRSSKDERPADVVKNYMRLFDRYSAVEEQIKQAADAEDEKEAGFVCEIIIYANDRAGLLNDVTRNFSERDINILKVNTMTSKHGIATLTISFEVKSVDELREICSKLLNIRGVQAVKRTNG